MMLSPTFMGTILDFLSLLMYVGPKAFIIEETMVNCVRTYIDAIIMHGGLSLTY